MQRLNVFLTPRVPGRGAQLLQAMTRGAKRHGFAAKIVTHYAGDEPLAFYGLGGSDRWPVAQRHMRSGGVVIGWDAGYWDRQLPNPLRRYRITFNGFHAPHLVMRGQAPSAERFEASRVRLGEVADAAGPVLLIGNGPKSNAVGAEGWSSSMSQRIRSMWPGRTVLYRPKPRCPVEPGLGPVGLAEGDIESVLKGASLVVTRHSNVAVDACRLGVPVVCENGAAAAIYPSKLEQAHQQPDRALRMDFLHRLAWWQWSTVEVENGDLFFPWLARQLQAAGKAVSA